MSSESGLIEYMSKNLSEELIQEIGYSERIHDGTIEMRWVSLPREHPFFILDPLDGYRKRTLKESEWRSMGIKMSKGWYHCGIKPEMYSGVTSGGSNEVAHSITLVLSGKYGTYLK